MNTFKKLILLSILLMLIPLTNSQSITTSTSTTSTTIIGTTIPTTVPICKKLNEACRPYSNECCAGLYCQIYGDYGKCVYISTIPGVTTTSTISTTSTIRPGMCYATDPPSCLSGYPCGYDPFTPGNTTCSSGSCKDECKDTYGNPSSVYLNECYCELSGACTHIIYNCNNECSKKGSLPGSCRYDVYNRGYCYCEGTTTSTSTISTTTTIPGGSTTTSIPLNCQSTDSSTQYPKGDNPFLRGSATPPCYYENGNIGTNIDNCMDSNSLDETYCPTQMGYCYHKIIKCSDYGNMKCMNGVCVNYDITTTSTSTTIKPGPTTVPPRGGGGGGRMPLMMDIFNVIRDFIDRIFGVQK